MRFFVDTADIKGDEVTIAGTDARHAGVLRLNSGDEIEVSDGSGREYLCRVVSLHQRRITARIMAYRRAETDPPVHIHLYQGVAKGERMDYCIQKATEVGVNEITPMITERSVVSLEEEKAQKRLQRWQRIALEAAKQSGRARVPRLNGVVDFERALGHVSQEDVVIFPWEEERSSGLLEFLADRANGVKVSQGRKIVIFIGPEGGFALEEAEKAKEMGAVPVTLGPRIFRTETAGPLVAALVLYEWGDLGRPVKLEDWRYL